MNRYLPYIYTLAGVSLGLLATEPAEAATVTKVNSWGASGVPSYVSMYIYVPDQLAAKPPVVVACHSCGTPVEGYVNSITGIRDAADRNGFIIILPEATGRNCWDVGTSQSLTHDGGGDTEAIVQMVKYTLDEYDGDASRVYVLGGSSGAMMTQALLAVYPDVFRAGSARAGVPAGCWADGFAASNQWSNNCANGTTTKSAQQWGDQARGMFPGYMGHRPRVQIFHGTADQTIRYPNFAEAIKQWTNVLGLDTMPASTDSVMTPVSTYQRQFWKNECGYTVFEAWAGQNGSHSMAYEQDAILEFFGLDEERATDPEPECPPGGGTGGMGGMGGANGASGASGSSGSGSSGESGVAGMPSAGGSSAAAGSGGVSASSGSGPIPGSGGTNTGGTSPNGTGGTGTGGTGLGAGGSGGSALGSGGATSTAGNPGTGATSGRPSHGSSGAPSGGPTGSGGSAPDADSGGCAVSVGEAKSATAYLAWLGAGAALFAFGRRRRRAH